MQNDLISRSALLEHLDNGAINFKIPMPESHVDTVKRVLDTLFKQLSKAINEQPTAYDVEKVDEQILDYFKEQIDKEVDGWNVVDFSCDVRNIVRNGGKK